MTGKLDKLIQKAKTILGRIKDSRQPSNGTKYSMEEIGMGAFSVFMTQEPSFLSQQEKLAGKSGKHNFRTLFGCERIPTANHIRSKLDNTCPTEVEDLYHSGLEELRAEGTLKSFECLGGVLIATDGTCTHSSGKIRCKHCSTRKHSNGTTTYSHSALCTAIVCPGIKEAVPLIPEFIMPQDGHAKQDCEIAAMKRWFARHKETYRRLNPTILGDDLFAKDSVCKLLAEEGYHFVFTCKPDSHKTLYEYLDGANPEEARATVKTGHTKSLFEYRFMNGVPIRNGDDAMLVNWVEVVEIAKKSGKILYRNTFITNHHVTAGNVAKIAVAGRARWKIENENNHTLKTKGYEFEHNYGHGKQYLSMVLASLAIVAFLYHTVANLVDASYIAAKKASRTRINFFDKIRAFTSILIFGSWERLMRFLMVPQDLSPIVGII